MSRILVTGAAGFIGFHLAGRLLDRGDQVVGVDSLNEYYDVRLKEDRLSRLQSRDGFSFHRISLARSGDPVRVEAIQPCEKAASPLLG